MPHWDTIAIVGAGLIGGSVGLAVRERRLARRVIGIGRRAESLQKAQAVGAIDAGTLDLAAGVQEAQLIIVCTPVARIAADVQAAAAHCPEGALVTDAGSTKAEIVKVLDKHKFPRRVRFVGSHPIAGGEKNGAEHGRADLFDGRTVVVTPGKKTAPDDTLAISDFWSALGATVLHMTPADHDRALAATSHLPHLVAAALAGATTAADFPLCGTGWRDTTRIAAGDAEMWTQIFLANSANTLRALKRFAKTLSGLERALTRGDAARLKKLLTEAKQNRDAVGS